MFVYKGHCLAIGVGIQVNNLFYYTTSIRVAQGAKYEIPQTRSIPGTITLVLKLVVKTLNVIITVFKFQYSNGNYDYSIMLLKKIKVLSGKWSRNNNKYTYIIVC